MNRPRSMIFIGFWIFAVFIISGLHAIVANGHSPIEAYGNTSLETALHIQEPTKSWAIYGEFREPKEYQYYFFSIDRGDEIYIQLFKPVGKDPDFIASFVLIGDGLSNNMEFPEVITGFSGKNYSVQLGESPARRSYEPFTPSALEYMATLRIDAQINGTYYIVVFSNNHTGSYGMAVGTEEAFTIQEIARLPYQIVLIYLWEGQALYLIFLPFFLVTLIGILFLLRLHKIQGTPLNPAQLIFGTAAIFLLGSAANLAIQMVLKASLVQAGAEIGLTLAFILIPGIMGISIFRTIKNPSDYIQKSTRFKFLVYFLLSFFLWAGFYGGPLFLLLGTCFASVKNSKKNHTQLFSTHNSEGLGD